MVVLGSLLLSVCEFDSTLVKVSVDMSSVPTSHQFFLLSIVPLCCVFIRQLGICPVFRMLVQFRGLFFEEGQVRISASKKYPGRHGDGFLHDV